MNSQEYRNLSEAYLDVYQEVDEATAMAKRGLNEPAIRNKIASQTRGGEFADKAGKLADRETYGNKEMKAGRENLARKQRGDFRDTTSSSPGLRGYGFKSNDPAVKAKQDARGNQRARAALTPNERKQLNMESYDLFDYMMEYLMIEGYADTNENALVIMANMSEEWLGNIMEKKYEPDEELPGSGLTPSRKYRIKRKEFLKHSKDSYQGPYAGLATKSGVRIHPDDPKETGRTRAHRMTSNYNSSKNESYDLYDVILAHLLAEGYADTNENALVIMANMSEEWRDSIVEAKKTTSDDMAKGDLYSAMFRRDKKIKGAKYDDPSANKYLNMKNSKDRQKRYNDDIGRDRTPSK